MIVTGGKQSQPPSLLDLAHTPLGQIMFSEQDYWNLIINCEVASRLKFSKKYLNLWDFLKHLSVPANYQKHPIWLKTCLIKSVNQTIQFIIRAEGKLSDINRFKPKESCPKILKTCNIVKYHAPQHKKNCQFSSFIDNYCTYLWKGQTYR